MKRYLIAAGLLFAGIGQSQAQFLQDVLLFSKQERGATARFKAMGNAQTALGGDLSSISGNPAGLGFFNRSDFSISLDYFSDQQDATYFGNKSNNHINRMGLGQIGAVFYLPSSRFSGQDLESGWLNFNIGIGHSKTNNYNQKLGYTGINSTSSFTHFLADQRDQNNPIEGLLGWDSYLLDFNENNPNNVYHYPAVLERNNSQKNEVVQKGFQSETNLSFGANYSNYLYLGASIGFSSFQYKTNQLFKELGVYKSYDDIYRENPTSSLLDPTEEGYALLESNFDMNYHYDQITKGNGINAKLGVIYKPSQQINLGISYTTPTWYRVVDEANTYMDTYYYPNGGVNTPLFSVESDYLENYLEYNLRTPGKINAGLSGVFGLGLITADVEFVDYSAIGFSASNQLDSQEKNNVDADMKNGISSSYTSALNVRLGGELRITPAFLARAGYAHMGSPYKDISNTSQLYSGGLGYRYQNMYLDVMYVHSQNSYKTNPYTIDTDWWGATFANPEADVKMVKGQAMLTLGVKF
jgi:hypothetical protein